MQNELKVSIISSVRENTEYWAFGLELNGVTDYFYEKECLQVTKFSSYRGTIIDFFSKKIPYFIVKNYIYEQEFIDSEIVNNDFAFRLGLNYLESLLKLVSKELKNKNSVKININEHDMKRMTIENIVKYEIGSIGTKANLLFDYIKIEEDFPEYYL